VLQVAGRVEEPPLAAASLLVAASALLSDLAQPAANTASLLFPPAGRTSC